MDNDRKEINADLQMAGLRQEVQRVRYNQRFRRTLCTIVGAFLVTVAVFVLVTHYWLPLVRVADNYMSPALAEGQIVIAPGAESYERGDIIAFYNDHRILVRRVIACEGDWVNLSEDGTVYVNDIAIDEDYLDEKALGDCDIKLPCQVTKGSFFVMADKRSCSLDSRDSSIGLVAEGQVVGKVKLRIWPPGKMGGI